MADRELSPPDTSVRLIAWTIGLTPIVLALATWGDILSPTQRLARFYALPILVAEIVIIILAVRSGIRPARPPWQVGLPLAALMALVWTTAAQADHSSTSLFFTSIWMVHLLYGLCIAAMLRRGMIRQDDVIHSVLAGFLGLLAILLAFVATHYGTIRDWTNALPAFNHIRWFGYYAAAAAGLCAWGWLRGGRLYSAIAVIALGAALWTGSRGAFAAVVGGYLAAVILFPFARQGWRRFLLIVTAAVILSALAAWIVPLGTNGPLRLIGADGDSGRTILWHAAIEGIGDHPWFGWGEAQFGFRVSELRNVQPHNVVLQILYAWGLVGGALVAWLALWLARRVRRAACDANAPLVVAVLNILALSLIDGSLFHVQSVSTFALCVAMLAAGDKDRDLSPSAGM